MWYITLTDWKLKLYNLNKYKKALGRINSFMVKNYLNKVGVKETYVNIMKAMYYKPTANIILHRQKLKSFPLR